MNLEFSLLDWSEAKARVLSGQADAILNMETDSVAQTPELIATIPTVEKQYVVYGRQTVSSVVELYGKRVASLHKMPDLMLEREITYLDSYEEIFDALNNGEYDFAICPVQVGNVFLHKKNIDGVKQSYAVSHVYGAIALAANNEALRDRLNTVISDMEREGRLGELDQKWITDRYNNMTLGEMVRKNPELTMIFWATLFLVVFLVALALFQQRRVLERMAYTERLQAQLDTINRQREELKEAKERTEASSRAKTTFLFNMSHDIRTPMNAIIRYITLAMREKNMPPVLHDYLLKIEASSQHLLALINDVLEMSRIESGKMDLELVPVDLVKMFAEVKDMFAAQMEQKNLAFTVDTSQIRHRFVLCDKNRMNRVFLNLISNAYKFTPEGGRISVTGVETAGDTPRCANYEIRVTDSGIGMTKEFAAKVFEAFERERNSTVSGIQGTGLGMAITQSIVTLMGGTIDVHTAPDEGTEFVVRLPFNIADQTQETNDAAKETAGTEAKGAADFAQKRLLLVDDMEINREIAAMLLANMGFAVETATNGKEAVEKTAAAPAGYFDAILMDVQMPIMDGYEATRQIRQLADERLANLPIIAMTANAFSEDVQKALAAGMNGHIAKPIDVNDMADTLREVLNV